MLSKPKGSQQAFPPRLALLAGVALVAALACASPAVAEERCGWLQNPTPGNWWLRDEDGEWIISTQGGPYAEGVERLPTPKAGSFVRTNGDYGYFCACVSGAFDVKSTSVLRVDGARVQALSVCRDNPRVKAP